MDGIEEYRLHKIGQAERRAAAFAAERVLYADDGTDGKQAIIDLAVGGGYRLSALVCDKLTAEGYDVPASVRPRRASGGLETTDAPDAPSVCAKCPEPMANECRKFGMYGTDMAFVCQEMDDAQGDAEMYHCLAGGGYAR